VSDGEARKLVTVVFCDLAESTAFADAHDPEVVTGVLSRYFEVVGSALERHGGTVEKFIGDAVVGVFGIPTLREDDAVRAVLAASAIQAGVSSLNEELSGGVGVRLAVRVGVNSGWVLARQQDEASAIAYGDPLNVAARLQQHAQPGDVLIGEETLGLVGSRVVVEASEPLVVKGKATPVRAGRLVGLAEEVPAFERPIRSRFVGRVHELGALRDRVARAREGEPQLVTVVGEPGIGKSRLIREVIALEAAGASPLIGRCLAYGDGITYWPLAEMLRQLERRAGGVDAILAGDPESELISSRLGVARGDAVAAGPGEVSWATRRLIERLAVSDLLIVVVDDIHWAEPAMLDLIEYVSATVRGRVMLLCAARPELLEAHPTWATPHPQQSLILLQPLGEGDVAALASSLVDAGGGDGVSTERLVTWSAGNPLFVEQIMAARDDGSLDERTPPQSIQMLLASRVDQLPDEERTALISAAVEGRLFHRGALRFLLGDERHASLDTALLALVRKQFVRADRSEFIGDDAYRFVHALVRDAAYDALPIRRRATLHERYADWLVAQPIELAEIEELLAYHLEQAHRFRLALGVNDRATLDVARRAGEHLVAAAMRAEARWDYEAVVDLLRRARPLLDEERWLDVAVTYAYALAGAESFPEAAAVLQQTQGDAERAGRADVACLARLFHDAATDPEAGQRTALAALERFDADKHPRVTATAYLCLGVTLGNTGRSGEAAEADLRGLRHARKAGLRTLISQGIELYSIAIFYGPTPAQEGINQLAEMLSRGDVTPRDRLSILPSLAALHAMRGDADQTRTLAAEAAQIQERLGGKGLAEEAVGNWLGPALAMIGDTDAAIELLRANCDAHRRRQATGVLCTLAANLGDVLIDAGVNLDEADALCEESQRFTGPDDVDVQILWRTVRAKLLRHAGRPDQALPFAEEAVAYAEQTDWLNGLANALALASSLHAQTGAPTKANELRARALTLYQQKGNLAGERHLTGEDAIAGSR
jgi:class 3 adenylate cyclase